MDYGQDKRYVGDNSRGRVELQAAPVRADGLRSHLELVVKGLVHAHSVLDRIEDAATGPRPCDDVVGGPVNALLNVTHLVNQAEQLTERLIERLNRHEQLF